MKILKWILIVLGSVIALVLIVALFVKKEHTIEKEIMINKPKADVYNYVKLLANQNNFSKWASMDPNMEKTFTGTDGTVGFVSAWKSKNKDVGSGEQEIVKIDDKRIDYALRFKEPWESKADAHMIVEDAGEGKTKVKWGFHCTMPYPMNAMCLLMNMDEMVGKDFQTGLDNLKALMEK